jgi:hypothetical protein
MRSVCLQSAFGGMGGPCVRQCGTFFGEREDFFDTFTGSITLGFTPPLGGVVFYCCGVADYALPSESR